MKNKDGHSEKELEIRINNTSQRIAEMRIKVGLHPKKETLSWLYIEELLDLKKERIEELLDLKKEIQKVLNQVIKDNLEFDK